MSSEPTLYTRLGGYDAVAALSDDLLQRLRADVQLGRFWQHRSEDGIRRELQLLIDFLCSSAGGPMYYTGRDMTTSHEGMGITESDWEVFMGHVKDALGKFEVPDKEASDVLEFVESTKSDIVEA